MTQAMPMASTAARQRAGWLVMGGVLVLAAGGLIACWGKVGLPLGLIGLAAAATALLRPERDDPGEPETASRTRSLQHLSQASLLTLVALQLAA
ncbi:hypothetical protein [Halomonas sp. M4R1S46]|uniref:hypothetical protein n=1 Tax=Halomonas sp. M4R1S46 TaxID=2982692 RepID=UPI0021E4A23C|nr:hypothetical protein [Halomonas sp. M4R1S46]UYG07620.1 hypothetical protein OCT48_18655 [Halomonas sp. M4R1S46]